MELHPILEKGEWLCNQNLWYVVSAKGQHPSMGVGQCCCHIPSTVATTQGTVGAGLGKLAILGGANPNGPFGETHFLDFDQYEWDEPELPGFMARYEHTAFIPSNQPEKIVVFGGAEKEKNLNCMQVLDMATKTWSTVATKGTPPSPRTCRGSASDGSRLYIFSGGHQGAEPVSDPQIHVFDADTLEWSQPPFSGKYPSPRHGHVSAICGDSVYVHGGMAGGQIFDDMHEYNIGTGTWKVVKTKGDIPSGRAAHGCVSHGNKFFIFGGMTMNGASDEAYVFDTRKSRWTKLKPDGPPPAPRLDHAMCLVTLPCPRPSTRHSRGGRNGSGSGSEASSSEAPSGGDPARSAQEFLTSCVDAVAQEMAGEGAVGDAGALASSSENEPTLCCLVHAGMDTQGEIFDDFLLLRLDNIL